MMAALPVDDGTRIELDAKFGRVNLKLRRPGQVMSMSLTTTDAGLLIDLLAGVACIADEQAFELDCLVALAEMGAKVPPRQLQPAEQLAPDVAIPAWLKAGGPPL